MQIRLAAFLVSDEGDAPLLVVTCPEEGPSRLLRIPANVELLSCHASPETALTQARHLIEAHQMHKHLAKTALPE